MRTIHDQRYNLVIEKLVQIRNEKDVTQVNLAKRLTKPQSYISKTESLERRLDVIELLDWLAALEYDPILFFQDIISLNEK